MAKENGTALPADAGGRQGDVARESSLPASDKSGMDDVGTHREIYVIVPYLPARIVTFN